MKAFQVTHEQMEQIDAEVLRLEEQGWDLDRVWFSIGHDWVYRVLGLTTDLDHWVYLIQNHVRDAHMNGGFSEASLLNLFAKEREESIDETISKIKANSQKWVAAAFPYSHFNEQNVKKVLDYLLNNPVCSDEYQNNSTAFDPIPGQE